MGYNKLLSLISEQYNQILCDNLVGIYVHGSIAFGCFNWDRSDIDFIVVVKTPLTYQIKVQLLDILLKLKEEAPPNGFEMSVVLKKHCRDFAYPTPYELHFSDGWLNRYLEDPSQVCNDEIKTDIDLAAHFTVIKNVGIVLSGKSISEIFGNVPKEDYLDSICKDVENAILTVVNNPVYIILNLCRVYAYMKNGLVLSKEDGGRWGLTNLAEKYHNTIAAMLDNYINGTKFDKDESMRIKFCEYMINLIFNTAA